jgi:type I restriction enzyme S subunit
MSGMKAEEVRAEYTVGWVRPEAATHPTVLPLADVAEIVSGYGFPKDMQGKSVGELPFFKVGDISAAWNSGQKKLIQAQHYLDHAEASSIRAKPFPKGTVVFAKIGEAIKLNRRAILGQLSIVDNNVMGLIPIDGVVDPSYLFYWSLMLRLGDISQATTVPSVRKSDVEQLSFPWVPLDQQKRIVAEIEKQFSRLDEAVANLKRVKANLKRYKAAVLKAAVEGRLVETEAERARREGRSFETGAQLLQRILETRRSEWQGKGKYKEPAAPDTADLPELPAGWEWASVDQLVGHLTDGDHQAPPQTEQGIPFLVIGNVRSGEIDFSDTRFVGETYYKSLDPSRQPRLGDLLYTLVGSYGIPVRVTTEKPFCIQRHMAILRPHQHSPMSYLTMAMESNNVFKQATAVATGTAQMTVPLAGLRRIAIRLPPITEQERITAEVDRRFSLLRKTEAQVDANLQRAERLRQSVLSKAFSTFPITKRCI